MTSDHLVGGPPERRRRFRVARSRRRLVGLGLVATVGLAIAVPRLSLHAENQGDRPAGRTSRSPLPTADRAVAAAATQWPLRGDLADDDVFVAAAMSRLRRDLAGADRALFAGRLPDGSRLLLATVTVGQAGVDLGVATSVSALHVAARHASTTGTVSPVVALTDPAQALGWATAGRDGQVYAVTLGPPGLLRVEVSGRVEFGAAGQPTRRWQTVSSENGVVLADLGTGTDPSVAVRSLGRATFERPVLIPIVGRAVTPARALTIGGVDDPGYHGPRPRLLAEGLVGMTEDLLDLGSASARVLWSGAPWGGRRLAMVLITRPGRARLQAVVGEQSGRWFPVGVRALPGDGRDDIPWLVEPFSSADPTMLLCPTGPGILDYLRSGHAVRRIPIRPDGVAMLLEPSTSGVRTGGAVVRLRDRSGNVLLTTRLPITGFDDPLAITHRT